MIFYDFGEPFVPIKGLDKLVYKGAVSVIRDVRLHM
jgi:hypothetical protein